ncbi:MAG: DUF1028 domain-containing protein [Planctomycetota bacterium]
MSIRSVLSALLLVVVSLAPACTPIGVGRRDTGLSQQRPVSTYSIVARDPATGQIGVAVQSHWFSVGSVVPWAEAGVGAVATQSLVDPSYGPLGLAAMRAGRSAPDALKGLIAGDEGRALRQVAMIDASGHVMGHTGAKCIKPAGHVTDSEGQFSVQANLMSNDRIWGEMARAYREAKGDLADRMIAALEAAEAAGGDVRGRQSAALIVVSGKPTGRSWIDREFDLRVEDHAQPVEELKRLVRLQRAYLHMNAGDLAIEKKDAEGANREYSAAEKLAPQIVEIPFWRAVSMTSAGQVEAALPIFKRVFEAEPIWVGLVPRLVESGLLPSDETTVRRILEQAKKTP